jgi:hypothetical protein
MSTARSDYYSFLLRLWRANCSDEPERPDESAVWRASLQDALTGEQVSFASPDDLFDFLLRRMRAVSDGGQESLANK